METLASSITKALSTRDQVIPVNFCDDEVLITDKEVFTYMVVEGAPIGVPKSEELVDHIEKVTKALEGTNEYECQIYLATRAFDTEKWLRNVIEKQSKESAVTGIPAAPAFHRFMVASAVAMSARGYKQYTRYIGIRLGKRKTIADKALGTKDSWYKKAFSSASARAGRASKSLDPVPTVAEVKYWADKARKVRAKLASSRTLTARGATARDMYELLWHMSTLGMNVPPPPSSPTGTWGAFELAQMDVALNNEHSTHIELSVPNPHLLTEYRVYKKQLEEYEASDHKEILAVPVKPEPELKGSFVALSVKLPDAVAVPWLLHSTTGDQSVDASIRFRVKSTKEAKEEASKAVISLGKEIRHQEASGIHGGTDETNNQYQQARTHSAELNTGNGQTQAEFSVRFFVHSPDSYKTQVDAQEFVTSFSEELDTKLEWIKDSHGTFYMEAIPGSPIRSDVHHEKGDLAVIVNGMPFATRHIGHMNDGFYMGAYGQVPFLYDLAAVAKQGKAPTCVCHGTLGGGKTVCVMQYVDTYRLRGYTVIIIDPKKDFNSHFALPGRGHARLWELSEHGRPGMLDPFILVAIDVDPDDPERNTQDKALQKWKESTKELVSDTILRCLKNKITAAQESILESLINDEMQSADPSMESLMERMRKGEIGSLVKDTGLNDLQIINQRKAAVHDMYAHLISLANSERGRLIFGKRKGDAKIMLKGVPTTIINVAGLDLPQEGAEPEGPSQLISTTIFSLLCAYSVRLLKNPKIKGSKLLVVDEANVVKGLPAFKSMSANINSQARSLNITPIYIDQSSETSTKDASSFSNKVGTRIVFKSSLGERENIAKELGWKRQDAANLTATMPDDNAEPGLALHTTQADKNSVYPNYAGLGVVRFDRDWNPEYQDAFETNNTMEGFVRAAYRSYPFDEQGVLYDPESPALNELVYEEETPLADLASLAESEAAMAGQDPNLPSVGEPVSLPDEMDSGIAASAFEPSAAEQINGLRSNLATMAPAAAAASEANPEHQPLVESSSEQEYDLEPVSAGSGGLF